MKYAEVEDLTHTLTAKKSTVRGEMMRYALVSVLALAADLGSLLFFTEIMHVHYLISATLAFCLGIAVNYACSRTWVFQPSKHSRQWIEFAIFLLVGVTGLGLNNLIIWLLTAFGHLFYFYSKLVATGVVFFWNFFLRKYLIYSS